MVVASVRQVAESPRELMGEYDEFELDADDVGVPSLQQKPSALVVDDSIDIAMPGMDGYSLATALRSRPEYQEVPLVAVTGFDQYDDRERALAAGFNTHLRKPIDPLEFTDLIQKLRS